MSTDATPTTEFGDYEVDDVPQVRVDARGRVPLSQWATPGQTFLVFCGDNGDTLTLRRAKVLTTRAYEELQQRAAQAAADSPAEVDTAEAATA